MPGESRSSQHLGVQGARIFVAGVSTVTMGVLPLLVGLFAERLRLDWQQIGWLTAAGQAGTLAGTLLAYALIERRRLRSGVLWGAAGALVFAVLTAAADSYPGLIGCRILTSVGVGCVLGIGTYLLSRAAVPARSFSLMSGVQVACGSLHALVLPWLYAHAGYEVAVGSIAFWFALILLLAVRFPGLATIQAPAAAAAAAVPSGSPRASLATVRLLGSVVGFQSAAVVTWIYSERMATAAGLAAADIGTAIALGSLGGVMAGALGGWAGDRFGYFPMLVLATAALLGGDCLMFQATAFPVYLGGQLVFNFGWMLGLSYYLGLLAARDVAGRIVRLAPPALVVAGALGPLCVAVFTSGNDAWPILALSCVFSATALVMAVLPRP